MLTQRLLAIRNVVTTSDLGQPVDAKKFNNFSWGRFDIENNYNGRVGYIKDEKMQGRVTIFLSGKMISTGAKSVPQSIQQLQRSMHLLVKNHFVRKAVLEPKVRNIVATLDLGSPIDLKVAATLSKCVFEPDQFPAIIYKPSPGVSFLIFASGKLVIAGARSEEQMKDLVEYVSEILEPFIL